MQVSKTKGESAVVEFKYKTPAGEFYIHVRHIDDHELEKIQKKCQRPDFDEHHRKVYVTDHDLVNKYMMNNAVTKVTGLKREHVRFLINPNVKLTYDKGENPEDVLIWDDVKDILYEHGHQEIVVFVASASRELTPFNTVKEENERKNSNPGSGTDTAKTSKHQGS